MVHSLPHLSILFVPVFQARLAAMKEGRAAPAAQETKVCISGDTVETGQRGFSHLREAWENDEKHAGILNGMIINSCEPRHLLCAAHYAKLGSEFPDGLPPSSLLKLTLSLWHFQ